MRILFINTVPTERNGITGVIFNYLESFTIEEGDKIGYVAINNPDDSFKKRLDKVGADLYVIGRKISNPVRYVKQLAKVAKNYDIIHAHGNSATLTLEMLAGKLAGCKLRIAHSHNTTCTLKFVDRICRPIFHNLCNGRMACGIDAGKWLFGNREFKVINNGINTAKYRFDNTNRTAIRADFDATDSVIIGHIGNFLEQKNHRFLIEIFAEIVKIIPSAKLLLLGDGHLHNEIESEIQDFGLTDSVIFAGSVSDTEKYMSAMDLVVMPSLFEGLPLTLVEEQANGLQCLVADTITKEADMTGNIHYKSLSDSASGWACEASMLLENRENRTDSSTKAIASISRNGYDIFQISKRLKEDYNHRLHIIDEK